MLRACLCTPRPWGGWGRAHCYPQSSSEVRGHGQTHGSARADPPLPSACRDRVLCTNTQTEKKGAGERSEGLPKEDEVSP